jgi:hypothetical protein
MSRPVPTVPGVRWPQAGGMPSAGAAERHPCSPGLARFRCAKQITFPCRSGGRFRADWAGGRSPAVRKPDDDHEGCRLVPSVRCGSGWGVTWLRAQMVLRSALGMDAAA